MTFATFYDSLMIFQGILFEAVPYVVFGVVVSAFLKVYIKDEWLLKIIPKNRVGGVLVGSLLGCLFPVCECGNIPVARRLIKKGVAPYIAITFLLAAPVVNPIVLLSTYVAFPNDPIIFIGRGVFALLIAIVIGLLFSLVQKKEDIIVSHSEEDHSGHAHGDKFQQFVGSIYHEIVEMLILLILGTLIASVVQGVLPRSMIISVGQDPVTSVFAMMVFASIISICSTVDAFFALSFASAFTSGSLLAFLLLGPLIDIKTLLMLRSAFTKKTILWMAVLSSFIILTLSLFITLHIS